MFTKLKVNYIAFIFFLFIQLLNSQNNLRILSATGAPFRVFVNSKMYNELPQAEILIENIQEDTLSIKFEFENKLVLGASVYLLNKGLKDAHKEYYYFVSQKNGQLKLDFNGISEIIDLPKNIVPTKPSFDSSAIKKNTIGHLCELKNNQAEFFNNLPNNATCKLAMPDEYLSHLKKLISTAQSTDDKLQLAQETCKNNCLSLIQLKTILTYLDLEFDKLIVAKLGYFNLIDTVNKSTLLSSFKFDASVKDYTNFLIHAKEYKTYYAVNCNLVSDDSALATLIQKQAEASNDSFRIDLLEKNYFNYCFSVEQISKILSFFTHDREKLQACKLLYFKCAEKENYQSLSKNFSFPQYEKELMAFIKMQKK